MGKWTERPLRGGGAAHQRGAFLCCLQRGWYFSRHTFWEHLCGSRSGSEAGRSPDEGPGQGVSTALPHSSSQFESVASSIKDAIQSLLPGTQLFSSFSFLAFPWQWTLQGLNHYEPNQMVCPWGCRVPAPGGSPFCHMYRRKKVSCVIQILKVFLLLLSNPKSSVSWIV